MALFAQSLVVSRVSLLSMTQRFWSSLVIVIGMTCVVGVLLSMLSLTAGLLRASLAAGGAGRAIVLSSGSPDEFGTGIARSTVATVLDAPGIAKGSGGRPLADGEVLFWLPPAPGFTGGSLYLRGVGSAGPALRPQFGIVAGRMFRAGHQELIVGENASRVFGLKVGRKMILPGGEWPIVGVFSTGGSVLESQLLTDVDTLMSAAHIESFGSILVGLESPRAFDSFKEWVSRNPTLEVTVETQSEYYLRTASGTTAFFTAIAFAVGAIMALGAFFGSVRITYAAVSSRRIEIAILRAIGYGAVPIALSVVLEAVFLSLIGALLGAWLAWLVFDGQHIAYFKNVFDLSVPPRLFVLGLGWAVVIALLGGLLPAVRSARLPVAEALRVT